MKTIKKGPHFWQCSNALDGIPLVTFGATKQTAHQRMVDYLTGLGKDPDKRPGEALHVISDICLGQCDEYDGLLDAWYGYAAQPGRSDAYHEGYCCGSVGGGPNNAPDH